MRQLGTNFELLPTQSLLLDLGASDEGLERVISIARVHRPPLFEQIAQTLLLLRLTW